MKEKGSKFVLKVLKGQEEKVRVSLKFYI